MSGRHFPKSIPIIRSCRVRSMGQAVLIAVAMLPCFVAVPSSAEPPAVRLRKANQVSKRANGSAASFIGKVALVELYVADDLSRWHPPKRTEIDRRIDAAIDFLQRNARIHRQEVQIQRIDGGEVTVAGRISTDPHTDPSWTEGVIRQGCGHSSDELVRAVRGKFGVDEVAICLHVDRPGISYNLAYYDRVDPVYASERMVCFCSYPDGRQTAAASYAHELLHLFGAGDLYFPYDSEPDRADDARRLFPSDVMLRVDYDIGRLMIGSFTAFRVGWRDSLEPGWKHFED